MPKIYLKCVECTKEFYFSEKDQERYKENSYQTPKRCFQCRQVRKQAKESVKPVVDDSTSSRPEYSHN